ncbi:MAG: UDP-N-acetylmuramate--L-alanine ligase [Myxococcota bacterium]|nr:UDP-N-acetylmuramate--L-alanine ligase [Myxococcota bacterium]
MLGRRKYHVHLVGIGGSGMSGVAEVLVNLGFRVSGSDLKESETTRRLAELGCGVSIGHAASSLTDADVVVISSAVKRDNPEVVAARLRKIPVIPRAEMLAEIMNMKSGVAVAGTHGKTSTTTMVAGILAEAGLDPTMIIGGKVNAIGANARLGGGEYVVAEADESDGSFLHLSPDYAIVTNIDREHMDFFGSMEALSGAFLQFINRIPFYGLAVLCLDHPNVQALLPRVEKRFLTYGFSPQAQYRAANVELDGFRSRFQLIRNGAGAGGFELRMVGEHNVLNSLSAIAIADELGVDLEVTRRALASFQGVQRRFTVCGEAGGIMVVDDYGHHPAEIHATLKGAREAFQRRTIAVFQPHRHSRTADLFDEFPAAFNYADQVIVTRIYGAGEEPVQGVTAEKLAQAMRDRGHRHVEYVDDRNEIADRLEPGLRAGDLVITFGAGDIWMTANELARRIASREQGAHGSE